MQLKEIVLKPEEAFDEVQFKKSLYLKLGLPEQPDIHVRPVKRSIDARQSEVLVRVLVEVSHGGSDTPVISYEKNYEDVSNARRVLIVGSGPAGLFAGLRLIEMGLKPVIFERGSNVQDRRRDLAAINKMHQVNPESNYCFGEGGAGTYSDGKLYTRSKKRGSVRRILEIMVAHGAKEDILFDAHPHIGTNKLPKLVSSIRESILNAGGEIYFDTRVDDFILKGDEIKGIRTQRGDVFDGEAVILATGHSARDIFELLVRKGIHVESKPFALGVRVEHPQNLIDRIQYHCKVDRGPYLPASSYSLVHQATHGEVQRGVFSFCMCPGGFIVPAATSPGEIVVNGMSPSRRDSRFANSGIVVAVEPGDFGAYTKYGPLAGMYFQAEIEKKACEISGGTQSAPSQRVVDFLNKKHSASLNDTSYQPGLTSVMMDDILPAFLATSLRQGFQAFGKKMKGYVTNEANVVGVESRTSSPVKVPRDPDSLEHVQITGLFPSGEGAGYAGGIISAAMDGERCAEAAARKLGVFRN